MRSVPKKWEVGIAALAFLAFIYGFPRLIIAWLGEESPWTSYLYQYGFGLVVFLIGIRLIINTGACRPGRGRDTFWFRILLAGFVLYAVTHAIWIILALRIPVKGGM